MDVEGCRPQSWQTFFPVSDVVIPGYGSSWGRQIKTLVTLNLEKPLLRGTTIKLDKQVCRVDFKYEQLAAFCYYCGKIGLSDRMCAKRGEDLKNREPREGEYGDWLKGISGRSVGTGGEGRFRGRVNG